MPYDLADPFHQPGVGLQATQDRHESREAQKSRGADPAAFNGRIRVAHVQVPESLARSPGGHVPVGVRQSPQRPARGDVHEFAAHDSRNDHDCIV